MDCPVKLAWVARYLRGLSALAGKDVAPSALRPTWRQANGSAEIPGSARYFHDENEHRSRGLGRPRRKAGSGRRKASLERRDGWSLRIKTIWHGPRRGTQLVLLGAGYVTEAPRAGALRWFVAEVAELRIETVASTLA